MRHVTLVAFLMLAVCPSPATAQRLGMNIEEFGTVSVIGGATPVKAPSGSHVAAFGGIRGDVGVQIKRLGLGLGGRYWQMAPTGEYGGQGVDFFFIGEWRPGSDTRTTLRGAWGYGFEDFDHGRGPERPTVNTDGYVWSIGIGRQVIAPFDVRMHLTADIVIPTTGANGRRSPVLEIGVGGRYIHFQPIQPL